MGFRNPVQAGDLASCAGRPPYLFDNLRRELPVFRRMLSSSRPLEMIWADARLLLAKVMDEYPSRERTVRQPVGDDVRVASAEAACPYLAVAQDRVDESGKDPARGFVAAILDRVRKLVDPLGLPDRPILRLGEI